MTMFLRVSRVEFARSGDFLARRNGLTTWEWRDFPNLLIAPYPPAVFTRSKLGDPGDHEVNSSYPVATTSCSATLFRLRGNLEPGPLRWLRHCG